MALVSKRVPQFQLAETVEAASIAAVLLVVVLANAEFHVHWVPLPRDLVSPVFCFLNCKTIQADEMNRSNEKTLVIRLSGPMHISWEDGTVVHIKTAKARALIAILASSPNFMRSRSWLQATLWSQVGDPQGRASLRQALSLIRSGLAPHADRILDVSGHSVALIETGARIHRDPADGEFLEGIDIVDNGFEDWLREMRAIAVRNEEALEAGSRDNIRPRIAVMPFLSLPLAEDDSLLGDALAHELLRILSRLELVDVISHLSSRTVGAARPSMAELRTKLGCNYVVTGSFRHSGGVLHIEADFHDALSDTHLATFECRQKEADFLAGDSQGFVDLAGDIVRETLTTSARLGMVRPLPDLAAHKLLMSAIGLMFKMGGADFERAGRQLREIAARAPSHALPMAWKAQLHLLKVFQGFSRDPSKDRQLAIDAVNRALDLDPYCAFSLAIDGNVQTVLQADFTKARKSFDLALELDPNNPSACQFKSVLHSFLGEGPEAVQLTERTYMLSPRDPRRGFFNSLAAAAYLVEGDYQNAIKLAENALRNSPRHISAHRARIVGLALADRKDEARRAVRQLMIHEPSLTIKHYLSNHPAGDMPSVQLWASAMESAGVPAA